MVIVTIIMIIAALAAPGMMRSMATSRAQRANGQLARIGRRARAESAAFSRAYALVYVAAGQGSFEMWRGINDSCTGNPWGTIVSAGGCATGAPDCVDVFDATAYNYGGAGATHRVQILPPPATVLCFEPNGDMYAGSALDATLAIPAGSVTVQVGHFDDGVSTSIPVTTRAVVFPPLAAPRTL